MNILRGALFRFSICRRRDDGRTRRALGAPYLHHGQASTLEDLFADPTWAFHTNAGNANFSVALADAQKIDDLAAFLRSIDAQALELAVPTDPQSGSSFDVCPAGLP